MGLSEADAAEQKGAKRNRENVLEVIKQTDKGKLYAQYWRPRLFRNTYRGVGKDRHGGLVHQRRPHRSVGDVHSWNRQQRDRSHQSTGLLRIRWKGGWVVALQEYKLQLKAAEANTDPLLGAVFPAADHRAVLVRPTTLRHTPRAAYANSPPNSQKRSGLVFVMTNPRGLLHTAAGWS